MVKHEFGAAALLGELKPRNRILTRPPTCGTPSLDNSLAGHQLDMAPGNVAAKRGEGAAHLGAHFHRFARRSHAGLHGRVEQHDLVKLFRVRQRLVDAFAARLEAVFLMDGLAADETSSVPPGRTSVAPKVKQPNTPAVPIMNQAADCRLQATGEPANGKIEGKSLWTLDGPLLHWRTKSEPVIDNRAS